MFYERRTWGPPSRIESAEDLAEKLTEHTWTLCTAFQHRDYLYLNDSTSEDGAQEYAIVKNHKSTYRQIESITFGWCSREKALEYVNDISQGKYDNEGYEVTPRIDGEGHLCQLCA